LISIREQTNFKLKAIRFKSTVVRLAAAAVVFFSFVIAGFVVIWSVANTSAAAADQKEVAVLLTELSPADPQTHRASAILHEKAFAPGDLDIALAEYEAAAAASPHNYLTWLLFGSALARAGETEKAEAALRRAKLLAPNYSRVQWALGNLLLREGRDDEGYAEIRKAIEGDPSLSASAVTVAMQLTENDVKRVQERFQGHPEATIYLAILLLQQKRFEEAREVYQTSAVGADTDRLKEAAKLLMQKAIEAKQFRLATEVDALVAAGEQPIIEKITNPGFESPVRAQNAGQFDWRVPQANFPRHAITDAQKQSGNYSLLVAVNSAEVKDFQGISQTVSVEPGQTYELSVPYRAETNSKAEYFWEVLSTADSKRIAVTPPLMRTSEWATSRVRFVVPKEVDGIDIRLMRGPCSTATCGLDGSLWFDDLQLARQ